MSCVAAAPARRAKQDRAAPGRDSTVSWAPASSLALRSRGAHAPREAGPTSSLSARTLVASGEFSRLWRPAAYCSPSQPLGIGLAGL